jgi:hypothetical protein
MRGTPQFLSIVNLCLVVPFLATPARADMPHNDMPHNSVSLQGLAKAAPLLDALANGALDDATIAAALAAHPTLKDQYVGALLGKIVSCALDSGTTLASFPPAAPAPATELAGELGLCGTNSPFGDWHKAPLADPRKKRCLEAVTACVLARVNAVNHRIVISVRSRNADFPFKLQKKVPVETQYRDKKKVASFEACGSGADCGYGPQFVGRCTPGNPVKVKATTAGTGIRICEGLYGCDTLQPMPPYTSVVVANQVDSAKFNCPKGGYYSVMTKPSAPVNANEGRYPAREEEVFTFPEGAFYGNIFRTDLLARLSDKYRDKEAPGVLAGDQNACFSNLWQNGVAEMNDRFCAGAAGCFVNAPMPCFQAVNDRCATDSVPPLAFAKCKPITATSSEQVWDLVITTYLNGPCDLSSEERQKECDPKRLVVPGWPPKRGGGDRDEGYEKKPRASKR